jgi:hypothetical protein
VGRVVIAVITVIILSSSLFGAGFASYRGYGVSPAESTSARAGSTRGLFIIGGGPSGGGK